MSILETFRHEERGQWVSRKRRAIVKILVNSLFVLLSILALSESIRIDSIAMRLLSAFCICVSTAGIILAISNFQACRRALNYF